MTAYPRRDFPPLPSEDLPTDLDPKITRVLDYWRAKAPAGSDGLPHSSAINLMDLHDIARNLLLLDVVQEDGALPRFLWRFWGTGLTDYFSVELTGHFIDEAYAPNARQQVTAAFDWLLQQRAPHFWTRRGGLAQDNQNHLAYHRLICPLVDDDGRINRLFGIITFNPRADGLLDSRSINRNGLLDLSDVD